MRRARACAAAPSPANIPGSVGGGAVRPGTTPPFWKTSAPAQPTTRASSDSPVFALRRCTSTGGSARKRWRACPSMSSRRKSRLVRVRPCAMRDAWEDVPAGEVIARPLQPGCWQATARNIGVWGHWARINSAPGAVAACMRRARCCWRWRPTLQPGSALCATPKADEASPSAARRPWRYCTSAPAIHCAASSKTATLSAVPRRFSR